MKILKGGCKLSTGTGLDKLVRYLFCASHNLKEIHFGAQNVSFLKHLQNEYKNGTKLFFDNYETQLGHRL